MAIATSGKGIGMGVTGIWRHLVNAWALSMTSHSAPRLRPVRITGIGMREARDRKCPATYLQNVVPRRLRKPEPMRNEIAATMNTTAL